MEQSGQPDGNCLRPVPRTKAGTRTTQKDGPERFELDWLSAISFHHLCHWQYSFTRIEWVGCLCATVPAFTA